MTRSSSGRSTGYRQGRTEVRAACAWQALTAEIIRNIVLLACQAVWAVVREKVLPGERIPRNRGHAWSP